MEPQAFFERFALTPDAQQAAAIRAGDGPVLLLAVPGSGKTTTLVSRLGYLLHVRGIPPRRILTMTYTVAAAADMRARYAALFGRQEAEQLEFRTINGVCSRIIRLYEQTYDRTAFRLMEDGAEKSALLGELYRAQSGEFATESTLKSLSVAITYAKNQMLADEELEQLEVEGCDFAALFRSYCAAMRGRQRMDYDDQMVYALQVLRRCPDLLAQLRARWPYLCVDEAQDTSKIQHEILRLLAGPTGNVFMVGDEDQSIYGFRAACPQALNEFERTYPGAQVLYLEQNYRSGEPIVKAADGFIRKNRSRRPKQMRAVHSGGAPVQAVEVWDRQAQYEHLCRLAKDCDVQTAVLYRDNDSALPLIDRLAREGIPYRARQVDSLFFSSRVVRDITDLIRFARDPADSGLFFAHYYKLGAGITKALAQQAADQNELPPLEYIADHPDASAWTRRQCRALTTHFTNLLEEPADRAVYRILHFMGYGEYLESRGIDAAKAEILQALGAAQPTPLHLLARLEELRRLVQEGSAGLDCPFILSTIHSSKGLEYDRVILMDVADGLLPKALPGPLPTQEEQDAWEEERRLFYVGMTRAKQQLQIVTFRKPGLASSFSRELFPPPPAPAANERPRPAARAVRLPALSVDASPPDAEASDDLAVGDRLLHRSFGPGVLTGRTGDIAVVEFDSGVTRKISLSTALRAHQLERL